MRPESQDCTETKQICRREWRIVRHKEQYLRCCAAFQSSQTDQGQFDQAALWQFCVRECVPAVINWAVDFDSSGSPALPCQQCGPNTILHPKSLPWCKPPLPVKYLWLPCHSWSGLRFNPCMQSADILGQPCAEKEVLYHLIILFNEHEFQDFTLCRPKIGTGKLQANLRGSVQPYLMSW